MVGCGWIPLTTWISRLLLSRYGSQLDEMKNDLENVKSQRVVQLSQSAHQLEQGVAGWWSSSSSSSSSASSTASLHEKLAQAAHYLDQLIDRDAVEDATRYLYHSQYGVLKKNAQQPPREHQ